MVGGLFLQVSQTTVAKQRTEIGLAAALEQVKETNRVLCSDVVRLQVRTRRVLLIKHIKQYL